MAATVADLGEEGLIALFASRRASADDANLVVPNGDDAAAWRFTAGLNSVITTDSLVEGYHFDLTYTPAHAVGRKLMAVNLSDLAAMGAEPRYALISVCFPGATAAETAKAIAAGVLEQAAAFGVTIIGGNTTGISGPIVLTATLIGAADDVVRRTGARVGDDIYVTGTLGDAAAGLQCALAGRTVDPVLLTALTDPVPRVAAGRRLAATGHVHAMCDISDGFGRDLRRLLAAAQVGATVDAASLPVSPSVRRFAAGSGLEAAVLAAAGGEDYELLVIASPDSAASLSAACGAEDVPLARVGRVTAGPAVTLVFEDGARELPTGFEHFVPGAA